MYNGNYILMLLLKCAIIIPIAYGKASSAIGDLDSLKDKLDIINSNLDDISRCVDKSLLESLQIRDSICLGETVLLPNISVKGIVGHWSFDKLFPIDESGHGNHITTPVTSGPPSNGHGASASLISGVVGYRIRANDTLNLDTFTIIFRIYLLGDYSNTFRNIISSSSYESQTPSILLYPDNNKISLRVSTTFDVEGLTSNSSIPLKRWTQISVVASENFLKLYLNGMLDSSIGLKGTIVKNAGDLIIGKKFKMFGFRGYFDELRIYNYAMGPHEIAAFVSNGLTGFYHSFKTQLGCTSCSFKDANSYGFCPTGYKLCSLDQLYIAGAHIARVNGWLHSSNQIWHKDIENDNNYRAALCCSIS